VSQLKNGNLNTKISFRENEEMNDLTVECNALAAHYRDVFKEIGTALAQIEKEAAGNPAAMDSIRQMKKTLEKVNVG
jgi:hypothetical protein